MTLHTPRLTLRPQRMDDAQALYAWQSDAETQRYINPPHTSIAETTEYLEWVVGEWQGDHQKYYAFGIELHGSLIGEIAFSYGCGKCGRCQPGEAALGFVFHRDVWGNGYATEAAGVIIEHCFSIGARKIKMACDVRNIAAMRVAEKLGFLRLEETETSEYNDGSPQVRNCYVLTKA